MLMMICVHVCVCVMCMYDSVAVSNSTLCDMCMRACMLYMMLHACTCDELLTHT